MNRYGYEACKWPMVADALKLEEQEEANCKECGGLEQCGNSCKGGRQVVMPYYPERPERGPVVALRRCGYWVLRHTEELQRHRFSVSGLGEHFWNRTFDNFTPADGTREALANMMAYSRMLRRGNKVHGKNGRLIVGPVGVGKTHLAVAVMGMAIRNDMIPCFCPAPNLLTRYAASFQAKDTQEFLDDMSTCELLIIDDMGKEKGSETAKVLLFQIVNSRYEQSLPLIITSNLTPEEIGRDYGEAMLSRIREMCELVVMKGGDYRCQ